MRILHTVESYFPLHHGMSEVVGQISKRLVAQGHEVSVATSRHPDRPSITHIDGVEVISFDIAGSMARGYRGDVQAYQNFVRASDFEVITNFAAQQWATDLCFEVLPAVQARKIFVPTGFSGLGQAYFQPYFARMPSWLAHYDATVFLSNDYRDRNFARAYGLQNDITIPNGAAADEFNLEPQQARQKIRRQLGIGADAFFVLHVGTHTGFKGHAECVQIMASVHERLPHAVLVIVANGLGEGCGQQCQQASRTHKNWLKVIDLSRADTVAAYYAADLFLFPSNIECSPIVLFECMAARLPFISTEVGNAREIISWSGGGQLAPTLRRRDGFVTADIQPTAQQVVQLAQDATQRAALANLGHAAWQENFSWEKIARDYARLYSELTTRGAFTKTALTQVHTAPLITVLMPVYNAAQYLAQAITSILAQTVSNFEFIIIDDGSSDTSYLIMQEYAQRDARIVLVRNEGHLKIAATLNKGVARARGKYIAHMDANDIALPQRLALQMAVLEADARLALCGSARVFDDGSIDRPTCAPAALKVKMLFTNSLAHSTIMVRRSVLVALSAPYTQEYEATPDYALWIQLLFVQGLDAANLPQHLLLCRLQAEQDRPHCHTTPQDQLARVQVLLLKNMSLDFSQKEWELYQCWCARKNFLEQHPLHAARALIKKIIRWNKGSRVFKPHELFTELHIRTWRSCHKAAILFNAPFLWKQANPVWQK